MSRPQTDSTAWKRVKAALLPVLLGAGLFSALINLMMLTGSVYMLQVYDRVLPSGSVPTLLGLFAVVVLLYALLGVYDLLRQRLLSRGGHRLDRELAGPVFAVFLARGAPGPLRDMDILRGFMGSPAVPGLMDLPWVPIYLVVLWILHPLLAALTLAGVALGLVFALTGQALSRRAMKTAAAPEAEAQAFVARTAESRELITALGLGGRITGQWRAIQNRAQAEVQRGSETAEILSSLSRATRMLLQSGLLTLGAWLAIRQDISAGSIVAASILSGRAMAPADQVLGQWRAIARARAAWGRLRGVLADPAAATGDAQAPRTDLPAPTGQISALRLTRLAPAPEGTPAAQRAKLLEQVSFDLDPGDGLAVVGASASGKSTLARLLAGVWPLDAGELRLDGATRDQWDPETLGRHFGYLPQVVTLLPGTVRDNIARFDPATGDAAVIEAARLAGVHEMILALPRGYDTPVGTEGLPLSGGQIQRLGLARAFLGRPRILVLDEPNAHLDSAGEEVLTRALMLLRASGSTVIVMAHRPSVLAVANKVLVLHQGRVAKFGPRDEVLPPAQGGPSQGVLPGPVSGSAQRSGQGPVSGPAPLQRPPVAPLRPRLLDPPLSRPPSGFPSLPGAADPDEGGVGTPPLTEALSAKGALSSLLRARAGSQAARSAGDPAEDPSGHELAEMPPSSPARLDDLPALPRRGGPR